MLAENGIASPFLRGGRIHVPLVGLYAAVNGLVLLNAVLHDPRVASDAGAHVRYVVALSAFRLPTVRRHCAAFRQRPGISSVWESARRLRGRSVRPSTALAARRRASVSSIAGSICQGAHGTTWVASRSPRRQYCTRYAWPSGRWGSLPLEGGIEAAYRGEIDAAEDPHAKMAEIEERLTKLRSPFRSAETFWIEEIIDPRETRPLICDFANLAAPLRRPGPYSHPMRP
jgi:Carboxyl transferase domain